jgi:hypothetical protein
LFSSIGLTPRTAQSLFGPTKYLVMDNHTDRKIPQVRTPFSLWVASKWRGLRARVEAGWLRRGTRLGAEHDCAVGAELLLQKKIGQRKDRLIVASSHFLGVSYFASRALTSSF